jgi:hypothetical protein
MASGKAFVVAQSVGEQTVTEGTSPASSGPAGSLFEGQVGAFFLLSLLVRAEPRGLPGAIIDREASKYNWSAMMSAREGWSRRKCLATSVPQVSFNFEVSSARINR